jgi:hypothetical protein
MISFARAPTIKPTINVQIRLNMLLCSYWLPVNRHIAEILIREDATYFDFDAL